MIITGDSKEKLRDIASDSVDMVFTDPPYFLVNDSGKGFMGKTWDSIDGMEKYLWKSEEFAQFVIKFFTGMKVENIMEEGSIVQENVNILGSNEEKSGNARFAKANLPLFDVLKKDFAHLLVLTRQEVSDLLNELLLNHTNDYPFLNGVNENAKFVIPITLLQKELRNIVQGNVLKFNTKKQCKEKTIPLTLMDGLKIKDHIEELIGKKSERLSIEEIIGAVKYAESIATDTRFNATILNLTNKVEVMRQIILLLFAINAMQKSEITQKDINWFLTGLFLKSIWRQCLRVLKPGCFAFIMSGSRADCLWRIMRDIEEAGFQISFSVNLWAYKSGFPKAMNIGKMIDKKLGCERVKGERLYSRGSHENSNWQGGRYKKEDVFDMSIPSSPLAKKMEGSYGGFQPKPSMEFCITAMKPLTESGYLAQAMKDGKGVTWLDDGRIPFEDSNDLFKEHLSINSSIADHQFGYKNGHTIKPNPSGRFPANILVSDQAIEAHKYFSLDRWFEGNVLDIPKASKREKNEGCEKTEGEVRFSSNSESGQMMPSKKSEPHKIKGNFHPTCKPIKLPAYFITIGTRPGDVVLDPFAGSGTTGVAAAMLNRKFIGIELNPEYVKIAEARIAYQEDRQNREPEIPLMFDDI